MKNQIAEYINEYKVDTPIITDDLYQLFNNVKKSTIRQTLKRLYDNGTLLRVKQGIYYKSNPSKLIPNIPLSLNKIIEEKYLKSLNEIVGYKSGINFANQLGLTSQTASIEVIVSNKVSNKKRKININKGKIVVNSPKISVTSSNYKLLQVLDLLNDYENYSELDFSKAIPKLSEYLYNLNLSKFEIETCVDAYPLIAQVYFYKSGVINEIIRK